MRSVLRLVSSQCIHRCRRCPSRVRVSVSFSVGRGGEERGRSQSHRSLRGPGYFKRGSLARILGRDSRSPDRPTGRVYLSCPVLSCRILSYPIPPCLNHSSASMIARPSCTRAESVLLSPHRTATLTLLPLSGLFLRRFDSALSDVPCPCPCP
jgi:hypothetical protein